MDKRPGRALRRRGLHALVPARRRRRAGRSGVLAGGWDRSAAAPDAEQEEARQLAEGFGVSQPPSSTRRSRRAPAASPTGRTAATTARRSLSETLEKLRAEGGLRRPRRPHEPGRPLAAIVREIAPDGSTVCGSPPLVEAGMTDLAEDAVRRRARAGLRRPPEKPAAPCLASRLPYGTRATPEGRSAARRGGRRVDPRFGLPPVPQSRHHGALDSSLAPRGWNRPCPDRACGPWQYAQRSLGAFARSAIDGSRSTRKAIDPAA